MLKIEQLLNSNYIKYNRLIDLTNEAFVGSNASTINIYVDLYSIFKILYSNKEYNILEYSNITSCIINLVSHYREFFRKYYKVESNFFIVYSKNCPYMNKQFIKDYNKNAEYEFNCNKLVDDMISNNIELLTILCPYLPNVYFIKSHFESAVVIYDLICRNELKSNDPHLVITKDKYNYQLIPIKNNVTIFRPKKHKGEDLSYYINRNNLFNVFVSERKNKAEGLETLMPELLSLLMALTSVKERYIFSLLNINTAIKYLKKSIANNNLLNGYNSDIQIVYNALMNDNKVPFQMYELELRFKAIDIIFQHSVFMNTAECKTIQFADLYDPESVQAINNKYFKTNPLDLNRL